MSIQEQEIGFDPDALRQKYKAERDKRVRDDGNDQYREVVGLLSTPFVWEVSTLFRCHLN